MDLLSERTVQQVASLLDFDAAVDVLSVSSKEISHAYVVSDHDRARAVGHILEWLETQDVRSMGLYGLWRYMWSDAAFASGESTGLELMEGRRM